MNEGQAQLRTSREESSSLTPSKSSASMIILCHERPKILGGSGFWEIKAGSSWKLENRWKSIIFGTTQLEIPKSIGGHMMCQNNGREGKEGEGREWPLATALATWVKHLCAARPP